MNSKLFKKRQKVLVTCKLTFDIMRMMSDNGEWDKEDHIDEYGQVSKKWVRQMNISNFFY